MRVGIPRFLEWAKSVRSILIKIAIVQEIALLDAAANELYKGNQQLNKQQIALNTEVSLCKILGKESLQGHSFLHVDPENLTARQCQAIVLTLQDSQTSCRQGR